MTTKRSKEEIELEMSKAAELAANGTKWPGMSYEDGVEATLRWILGETDDKPISDQ